MPSMRAHVMAPALVPAAMVSATPRMTALAEFAIQSRSFTTSMIVRARLSLYILSSPPSPSLSSFPTLVLQRGRLCRQNFISGTNIFCLSFMRSGVVATCRVVAEL